MYKDATHNTFTDDSMPYFSIMVLCDWAFRVRWMLVDGAELQKAANAKAKLQNLMTEAGQSSPSPLAGISQSEGAALET